MPAISPLTDLTRHVRQALECAGAVVERISDDGDSLRIWFRFVEDPVKITKVIDDLREQLGRTGTPRQMISYLRLI